jgi:hypothetical protein
VDIPGVPFENLTGGVGENMIFELAGGPHAHAQGRTPPPPLYVYIP